MNYNEKPTPSVEESEQIGIFENLPEKQEEMHKSEKSELIEAADGKGPGAVALSEVLPGITAVLIEERAKAQEQAYSIETSPSE